MASLWFGAIALSLTWAATSSAQFVPAPTDLNTTEGYYGLNVRWKEVPAGTCELTPGVRSYSGYVDVAEEQSIFFWFFEARNQDPEDAELTVWINGGPGSSSMIGLFQELGPCGVDSNGDLYYNPYAWNNVSNMLFIDHPAQVGFSYSKPIPGYVDEDTSEIIQLPDTTCPDYAGDSCGTYSYPNETNTANTTAGAAPSMWKTLQGFMGAFPQYSRNDFNFATESYGGHYGPIFNAYLERQNDLIQQGRLHGAHTINLKTLLIGNGWYDPLIQYQAYYNFSVYPGNTYDLDFFNQSIKDKMYNSMYGPGNCYDRTVDCNTRGINEICSAADSFCANEVESILDIYANRDEYDTRELSPDPFPYSFFEDYLNTPELQQAIGAYVNFSSSSETVYDAFTSTGDDDREDGTIAATRSLVNKGVYVVQYAGDADYNCNWLGGEIVSQHVSAPGFPSAGYQNITTSDALVHGQVKQSANFAFARIYEAGHEVPFYQPLAALEIFDRAIRGRDLATGRTAVERGCGYQSVGTARSEFREGNGTVQYAVLPADATYNTTTNAPDASTNGTAMVRKGLEEEKKKTRREVVEEGGLRRKRNPQHKEKRAYFKPRLANRRRNNVVVGKSRPEL